MITHDQLIMPAACSNAGTYPELLEYANYKKIRQRVANS